MMQNKIKHKDNKIFEGLLRRNGTTVSFLFFFTF